MLHAVGFLIDHRYIPDEIRKHDEAIVLQNRIKQVIAITFSGFSGHTISIDRGFAYLGLISPILGHECVPLF